MGIAAPRDEDTAIIGKLASQSSSVSQNLIFAWTADEII